MASLTTRQWLAVSLAATLAFRFWLALAVPITGDEAYFILWGRHPAIGFYDHPPMVGWLLAPLLRLSEAEWVLRLPVLLLPVLVALLVRHALVAWFADHYCGADSSRNCGVHGFFAVLPAIRGRTVCLDCSVAGR